MEVITVGEKFDKKTGFRETSFGINVKENKLLVVYDKNQYSLIGGGIDEGETKEDALKREFLEEVGYTIKSIKELYTIDCFWLAGGDYPMESLANIYEIELDEKTNNDTESQIEYIDLDKAIDLLPLPYHKKAIELYLQK